MDDGAAILVPRRKAGEERERLWLHVYDRLEADGWRVIEGYHTADEGEFNRSAAVNRAAACADGADVLVVLDADTIVGGPQIASAATIARATGVVTFAFGRYAALDKAGTDKILAGFDGSWEEHVAYEFHNTASSCLALRRDLWDRLGGFDERFAGWGWEDVALSLAAQTLSGGMHRVAGTAWHLWHPPSPDAGNEQSATYQRNRALCQPYIDATGDVDAMLEALAR